MSVTAIIDGLIKREGGYVNNPNDRGGETCWGITVAVARANGYTGPMRSMPQEFARRVYLDQYYTGPRFDRVAALSLVIAEELTDTGVNMGPPVAATFLQRLLNVLNRQQKLYPDLKVDGYLGNVSFAALGAYLKARGKDGEMVLLQALNHLQGARYVELCEKREANEEFIFGWIRERTR